MSGRVTVYATGQIQWGIRDVGVLHRPGNYVVKDREEAERRSQNVGDEDEPIYYHVPVRRTLLTDANGEVYASAWVLNPTDEQMRLKPLWEQYMGMKVPL